MRELEMTERRVRAKAGVANVGIITSVRGNVIDIRFDTALPPVHTLLRAGDDDRVAIEVLAQRDANHVRGIALTPTQGLARGMPVQDTGGPLQAPVGKQILSRMFDVFSTEDHP
jgi:F-type H+-transporting ATPase subunit beta